MKSVESCEVNDVVDIVLVLFVCLFVCLLNETRMNDMI